MTTTDTRTPEHTYNWTCFLVSSHSLPRDDDAPECQACRLEVTREAVAGNATARERWTSLREEITRYRDAHRERAADAESEGKPTTVTKAQARELDWVLATMDRMEEGR